MRAITSHLLLSKPCLTNVLSHLGDHDHVYTHAVKQKEDDLKAGTDGLLQLRTVVIGSLTPRIGMLTEREAKDSMRKYSGGKTYIEEKMEEKKRIDEAERQKGECCLSLLSSSIVLDTMLISSIIAQMPTVVQDTISGFARNNFSSPDFDPAYVRAKELEQIEREAEEKAKASLLQFSQHDVSHEMVMKNGFRVRKTSVDSDTSSNSSASPGKILSELAFLIAPRHKLSVLFMNDIHLATSYPFTDKSRKRTPSPAAVKAVARFQQQLGTLI